MAAGVGNQVGMGGSGREWAGNGRIGCGQEGRLCVSVVMAENGAELCGNGRNGLIWAGPGLRLEAGGNSGQETGGNRQETGGLGAGRGSCQECTEMGRNGLIWAGPGLRLEAGEWAGNGREWAGNGRIGRQQEWRSCVSIVLAGSGNRLATGGTGLAAGSGWE